MRGDINATELYKDREFLTRVGYGIMDVPVGSTGDVGFEDVLKYSYLEAHEEDPKLFRRRVFELIGRYYPNDLAKALWHKFIEHQINLHERQGWELSLKEAAQNWLEQDSHNFLKDWTLAQPYVPFRLRNQAEPRRSWVELAAVKLAPQCRELSEVGFRVGAIAWATLVEAQHGKEHFYLRVVARLNGHRILSIAEARQRMSEIEHLKKHLKEQSGYEISGRDAIIEYYRRLNLVAEFEGKALEHSMLAATAC